MSKLFNNNFLTDIYGISDIIKSNDYQLKDIGNISKQLTEKSLGIGTVSQDNKSTNAIDIPINSPVKSIENAVNIADKSVDNPINLIKPSNTIDKTVVGSTNDMVNKSIGVPPLQALDVLRKEIENCSKCRLSASRTNVVFGDGNVFAKLLFIGEGPGADEDKVGLPFIGRAGQLLTKMIIAMGFKKEDVYIANIVKCRPPNNRNPFEDETACCISYLHKQIAIIDPDYIIALGSIATKYLLNTNEGISSLRGRWQSLSLPNVADKEYQVMPTFHPAYLLRSPNKKVFVWQDLQLVMKEMGLLSVK